MLYSRLERRQSARILGIHKTIAVPPGRVAVRTPYQRSEISYNAAGSPWARTSVAVRTPWKAMALARQLYRVLCDSTASPLRFYGAHTAIPQRFTYPNALVQRLNSTLMVITAFVGRFHGASTALPRHFSYIHITRRKKI